jgi:hypothetical protein
MKSELLFDFLNRQVNHLINIFPETNNTVKWICPFCLKEKRYDLFIFPDLNKLVGLDYYSAVRRVFYFIQNSYRDKLKIFDRMDINSSLWSLERTPRTQVCMSIYSKIQKHNDFLTIPCNIKDYKGFSANFISKCISLNKSSSNQKFLLGLLEVFIILYYILEGFISVDNQISFLCAGDRYYRNKENDFSYVPLVSLSNDLNSGRRLLYIDFLSEFDYKKFFIPIALIWDNKN